MGHEVGFIYHCVFSSALLVLVSGYVETLGSYRYITTCMSYTTIYRDTAVIGIATQSKCYTPIISVTCRVTNLTISDTAVYCYTATAAVATIRCTALRTISPIEQLDCEPPALLDDSELPEPIPKTKATPPGDAPKPQQPLAFPLTIIVNALSEAKIKSDKLEAKH